MKKWIKRKNVRVSVSSFFEHKPLSLDAKVQPGRVEEMDGKSKVYGATSQ